MSALHETTKPLTLRAAVVKALAYAAGDLGQYVPFESTQEIGKARADLVLALAAIGVGVTRSQVPLG